MPERSVRFGVRAGDLHAPTWKLVARVGSGKNDVYLMCRTLDGALKSSLHESGSWHVGFVRAFVRDNIDEGDRTHEDPYIQRWPRPPDLSPGVTLAYRVLVPRAGVRVPIPETSKKSIRWIPAAPDRRCTEIAVIFTSAGTLVSEWPAKNSMNTKLVDNLMLENGDTIWIVHRIVDVPDLTLPPGDMKWFRGKSKDDLVGGHLRGIVFGKSDDGSRYVLETAVEHDAT